MSRRKRGVRLGQFRTNLHHLRETLMVDELTRDVQMIARCPERACQHQGVAGLEVQRGRRRNRDRPDVGQHQLARQRRLPRSFLAGDRGPEALQRLDDAVRGTALAKNGHPLDRGLILAVAIAFQQIEIRAAANRRRAFGASCPGNPAPGDTGSGDDGCDTDGLLRRRQQRDQNTGNRSEHEDSSATKVSSSRAPPSESKGLTLHRAEVARDRIS